MVLGSLYSGGVFYGDEKLGGNQPAYHLEFMQYLSTHGKSYRSREEYEMRAALFRKSYDFVMEWNAGNHSSTVELNKFADMTDEEFSKYNGLIVQDESERNPTLLEVGDLPEEFSWEAKGYVGDVQDQAACGSGWSFASTAAL